MSRRNAIRNNGENRSGKNHADTNNSPENLTEATGEGTPPSIPTPESTVPAPEFHPGTFSRIADALLLPRNVVWRIVVIFLLTWVPLAILSSVPGMAPPGVQRPSFLMDIAAYVRYGIVIPILIASESYCLPILSHILKHFHEVNLIAGEDQNRYVAALRSTRSLFRDRYLGIIYLILVALLIWINMRGLGLFANVATWWGYPWQGTQRLTGAGWWNALVSHPLYLLIVCGWGWRLFLWWRCLYLISCLNLRLQTRHPDRVGGLGFLTDSLPPLSLLGFGLSCIPAAGIADMLLFQSRNIQELQLTIIVLIALILTIIIGPLVLFSPLLRRTRAASSSYYGDLALREAMRTAPPAPGIPKAFPVAESQEPIEDGETPLSALGYTRIEEEYLFAVKMKTLPVDRNSILPPFFAVALPFVFAMLLQMPLQEILAKVKALIL